MVYLMKYGVKEYCIFDGCKILILGLVYIFGIVLNFLLRKICE